MRWKRRTCLVFGIVFGLGLTTLVGHYGYISSDDHKTGVIVAFIYAGLAAGALFGEGFCVLVWQRSRLWATVGGIVLAAAAITNISNSLDAVIGRSAKTYAANAVAKQNRADSEAEKVRLEARLARLDYTPTSDDAVKTAKDAVTSAENAAKSECGNGDPKQRGRFCRDREADERQSRSELKTAISNNALTKEAAQINTRLGELRVTLARPDGVQDAETAQQGGAVAIARLFRLPTTWGAFIADWKMLVFSAVLDLLVIIAFIFYEVLGWPPREERKRKEKSDVSTTRTLPADVFAKPQIIDLTPEAAVPAEAKPQPRLPDRPKPKLAIANKQPVGSVLDFLHDGLEITSGPRTEMTDAFIGYWAWCKTTGHRAMDVAEFVDAVEKACKQFGIRIEVEGDRHYLVDVRVATPEAHAQNPA